MGWGRISYYFVCTIFLYYCSLYRIVKEKHFQGGRGEDKLLFVVRGNPRASLPKQKFVHYQNVQSLKGIQKVLHLPELKRL